MSTIKVNKIENTATTAGGVTIDSSGHVTVDGLQMPSAGALSNRNKIINGDMRIDQRNAGASVPITTLHYPVDRFTVSLDQGSGHTTQRSTTAPSNFSNSLQVTVGTGASPAASDVSRIYQIIEGYNSADLGWGTASAKAITISFWVRSSTAGTYAGGVYNAAANRTYVFTYEIQSVDTWEPISVTIPGDITGTWETTNLAGIVVNWDLGTGSTYQGTAGSWAAGAAWATSSSVKLGATSGATFYITGVQLEAGNTATPFEHRAYSDELQRCQRYYVNSNIDGIFLACSNNVYMHFSFPVVMRASPTIYVSSNVSAPAPITASANVTGVYAVRYGGQALNNSGAPRGYSYTALAEL